MTSSIKASDLITELEKRHWKQKESNGEKAPAKQKSLKAHDEPVSPHEHNSSNSLHPSTSAFLITLGLALGSGLYAWVGWMGVIGALLMIAGCLYIMKV
jgi:hypothetical protein